MNNDENLGIVYVLTNPAMPGLVKIGKTSRNSVSGRLGELYSTGVPVPFECEFAGRVENVSRVEKAFHMAFGPYRINPGREFFEIDPDQAITLLQLMTTEDVTPTLQKEACNVDIESKDAVKRLKARRPNLNFLDMGIPVGSTLKLIQGEHTCEVISERRVKNGDEDLSLTALTKKLLEIDRVIHPTRYWTYQGRNLSDIYNEAYEVP
ncbi:MAG: GIY-YIG nuclease family protein [Gammaproteobacteria bacterium]|nr:GIY-YIG nuclease family protein [Gammaproteobacteria bacterium]